VTGRTDYAPYFADVAAAKAACGAAKAEIMRIDREVRKAAMTEAAASMSAVGVVLLETRLTVKGRWEYQNKPILVRAVTCWSTPVDTPKYAMWQLQAHYTYARKDGKPNRARNEEYSNIVCSHPAEFAAALLKTHPIWAFQ
jgi:hypothetical protein